MRDDESTFRLLFLLASVATALVACWLFSVIVFVLPARDPSRIPMWRTVAVSFLVYSALSWLFLARGRHAPPLRWTVRLVSVVAIGFGLSSIVEMLRHADNGGHFEGYIVLIGLILCAHGASAVLYTFSSVPPSSTSSPASR